IPSGSPPVPNLPFMLDAPQAFFAGITAPMLGALAPYGVGFVRFGMDGDFPLLPRGAYGALSAASFIALVVLLWRYWRRIPTAATVFPFVPLYLAWRSLQNYFGWVPLLAMAGDELLTGSGGALHRDASSNSAQSPPTCGAAFEVPLIRT